MSIFLEIPPSVWVASNEHAFAFRDRFPVSPGHTLVVTRRVISDWFLASEAERRAIFELVDRVKEQLDRELNPHGYNVGFNAGPAAGQTVMHLHVHVIPRFEGDMDDPRGGVRHVIPSKGNYLRSASPLATGGDEEPFARHVLPLFDRAQEIAIVAAFVQESGVLRIEKAAQAALQRGARIRIVTGDYLNITQASALELLLDWQNSGMVESDEDEEGAQRARFEARVVEVDRLPTRNRSFHPKSWQFEAPTFGIAYVGSSNLSRSAIDTGIEWNLRVDRDRDSEAYKRIRDAFESLWNSSRPLTSDWVDQYAARARSLRVELPPGEVETEPLEPPPTPHAVQVEALARLEAARAEGRRRAIVVLATGLGKTWLAAFDYHQLAQSLRRPPRLLFLAHRRELLKQAARTYRRLLRDMNQQARIGWFVEDEKDLSADLVFASVAKLSRKDELEKLRAQSAQPFDYVVVDEVHHAAAASYRRILDAIDPTFLLGLTATPDRADSADILGLFDDFVAYRADIPRGIELGRLVPFHYFGVKDEIDYANIPWRNRRFDQDVLASAAQTESRMESLWRAWNEHPGTRTLIFCCSIAHADFARAWLRKNGVRVAAVYSDPGTDDRERSLEQLERGELDAVCAVDVFNEGVDIPSIDRVVMLRPTESSVVFLQQLGRGLRADTQKSSVCVIDFVGNHRIFLERLRALLSLGGISGSGALRHLLDSSSPEIQLPAGCSVDVQLEAKELLTRLFRVAGADEVERVYRKLCLQRGAAEDPSTRPTAGELQRMGYLPSRLRERHGSWFEFVRSEGGLSPDEQHVLDAARAFLSDLEVTQMTRSFKMVTLEVLLEAGAIFDGMSVSEIARRSFAFLRRSPELFADVPDEFRSEGSIDDRLPEWIAYWKRNPITAWLGAKQGRSWFRMRGELFALDVQLDSALHENFAKLARELTDYRLVQYRARTRENTTSAEGFVCKVTWNKRDPILKLPSRQSIRLPESEADVRLPDGGVWQFRFSKEFVNVARPAGAQRNQLPDLLRKWFGPRAGQPGTSFQVRFRASPDGLWVEPIHDKVIDLATRRGIVAYPDLRAAAGHLDGSIEAPEAETVMLPVDADSPELFAVRVAGSSMDGGKDPIRDGDWAVMRVARSMAASALEGRVVLVQVAEKHGSASQYVIKRIQKDGSGWALTSDNPSGPTIPASESMVPIARLDRVLKPEELAPPIGTVIAEDDLADRFGLETFRPRSGRHFGHLFIFAKEKGALVTHDRVRFVEVSPRPSEVAFVLANRADGTWRFLGIGRQTDEYGVWAIPEVDFQTWKDLGGGREVSRRLPAGALARAQLAIDALLRMPADDRWLEREHGSRARILGASARGGLRIDGGSGGFAERTVSTQDIAWVIIADDDVLEKGGLLDEERVNVLRYLEGTPPGSTRWIDTGWALAAWQRAKTRVNEPIAGEQPIAKVRNDAGRPIDAAFRVERVGDFLTVVFESRGGSRGSKDARNLDYAEGLELVLARLARGEFRLVDALVESARTAQLPPADRRIPLTDGSYPVAISDPSFLRKELSSGQAKIGRESNARGPGNATKRIRLFVSAEKGASPAELRALLEGPDAGS